MYDNETKNQFIELRADGLSLDTISARLNVPRATLGRWHHESIEQIQRLRSLQWHLLEEQIGHRLEDSLQRIAQRIRKWEDELDTRDPHRRNTVEVVRIIRDSRREYLQLRALLLAPLQPSRARPACLNSLDPQKRDKTRQTLDALDTTSLPTNDLQQLEPAPSHSGTVENHTFGTASFVETPHPSLPSHQSEISNVKSEIPSCPPSLLPSLMIPSDHSGPVTPDVRRGPTSDCNNHNLNLSSVSPCLCGESLEAITDTQPLINTPLQRGEPAQPTAAPTASAVFPSPRGSDSSQSEISNVKSEISSCPPSLLPSLMIPSDHSGPVTPDVRRGLTSDCPLDDPTTSSTHNPSSVSPCLCGDPPATNTKKHKPYWLNGRYYENPEYPENIARAMFARPAG